MNLRSCLDSLDSGFVLGLSFSLDAAIRYNLAFGIHSPWESAGHHMNQHLCFVFAFTERTT